MSTRRIRKCQTIALSSTEDIIADALWKSRDYVREESKVFFFFFFFFWKCSRRIRETDANSRPALLPEFFVSDTKGNRIKYSIHLVPPVRNQERKVRIIPGNRFSVELIVFVWCLGQSIRRCFSRDIRFFVSDTCNAFVLSPDRHDTHCTKIR